MHINIHSESPNVTDVKSKQKKCELHCSIVFSPNVKIEILW